MRTVLWDTSYLSVRQREEERRRRTAPSRLGAKSTTRGGATVGISVVTVAEVRFGYLRGRWGERRTRIAERWLDPFVRFDVTEETADTYARLKAAGRPRGYSFGTNDLWIAATACTLGVPLITCDRGFLPPTDLGVDVECVAEGDAAEHPSYLISPSS